jgi:hypothetical protein
MKAREWHQRGKLAKDPIDALTEFWRGFNNLFFPVKGRDERDKIRKFLVSEISEKQAEDVLDGYKKEIGVLVAKPILDMRGNGRNTKINIEAFDQAKDSLGKLQEVFMMIYQVRCNLEHGQKSPNRKRDVELCAAAFPIVAEIVGMKT